MSSIEQQAGGSAPLRFKVRPGAIWLCVRAAGPVVARWLPLGLRVGDKVEILSAGAETARYASVGFNGFEPLRTYCI